jgi:putative transposase
MTTEEEGLRPSKWATFVRNHAAAIVACDFMVAVTAKFQLLYVFVILELGSRRILWCNVTAHPTAEWTLQQFRDGLFDQKPNRFLIHDRDSISSRELDQALVQDFGLRVLRTPPTVECWRPRRDLNPCYRREGA